MVLYWVAGRQQRMKAFLLTEPTMEGLRLQAELPSAADLNSVPWVPKVRMSHIPSPCC